MHFHFMIVFMSLFWFCPLDVADEAAASRLPSALQQDFFSLLRKPNHAKGASCLEVNVPSRLLPTLPSWLLCPLRRSCPLLHSVTQHLQAHTGIRIHNCPQADSIWTSLALCLCCLLWQPPLTSQGWAAWSQCPALEHITKFSNGSLFQACELHESTVALPLHLELEDLAWVPGT